MKNFIELLDEKRGKIPLNMRVGTEFVDKDGVEIKIIDIQLTEMHKSKPRVLISYEYNNKEKKHKGREDNYLEFFVKEIIGDQLK